MHRKGAPTTIVHSSAWAGLRTDRASLFLLAGPVLTRYRSRLDKSDVFGVISRLVLTQQPSLDELAALPVEDLTMQLHQMSGHHLPDPFDNARKRVPGELSA